MNDDSESDPARPEVYRQPPEWPPWSEDDRDDVSVVEAANVLLRHRRKVVGTSFVVALLVVGVALILPPSFTADTSFLPQTGSGSGQLSQLSGVAAQFGINVPAGQAGQSPQFYANLLTSRRVLEEAVSVGYSRNGKREDVDDSTLRSDSTTQLFGRAPGIAGAGDRSSSVNDSSASLVELYEIEAENQAESVAKAAERLEDAVSVTANSQTGVVELSVTTPWPSVSKQIIERLVTLVNTFNNRLRQSQAAAQAEFASKRLEKAQQELRAAEDRLETFLQRNVGWQQSPSLRFEHDRLQRRVNLKQQVYTSLASRYEEARIDEVRNTPVVTMVTAPQVPARPDRKRLPLKGALGLVLGGIMGVGWAIAAEFGQRAREEGAEDYREFVSLKQDALEDVKRAGRRIRRLLGSGPKGTGRR